MRIFRKPTGNPNRYCSRPQKFQTRERMKRFTNQLSRSWKPWQDKLVALTGRAKERYALGVIQPRSYHFPSTPAATEVPLHANRLVTGKSCCFSGAATLMFPQTLSLCLPYLVIGRWFSCPLPTAELMTLPVQRSALYRQPSVLTHIFMDAWVLCRKITRMRDCARRIFPCTHRKSDGTSSCRGSSFRACANNRPPTGLLCPDTAYKTIYKTTSRITAKYSTESNCFGHGKLTQNRYQQKICREILFSTTHNTLRVDMPLYPACRYAAILSVVSQHA
jgi:hypothetical protein